MCAGFPRLGVLRRLRPVPGQSVVGAPSPAPPAGYGQQGKTRDSSRVHCGSLAGVGARLYPCGLAASTPQSFLAASLAACAYRLGSSPPTYSAGARRSRPRSTRFEPVPHQGAVTRRFLAYSSPARSPDPGHLAVLARPGFVRAAPTLPGTTRISRVGAAHYCYLISSGFPADLPVPCVRDPAWGRRSRVFLPCCRRVDASSLSVRVYRSC